MIRQWMLRARARHLAGGVAPILILAGVVLASRLPFLAAGFGEDADAWRVANAAHHLATTGDYQVSRLPGFPLPEFLYAAVWRLGGREVVCNGLTAVFSAGLVVAFCGHLRQLRCRDHLLAGLALAFTSVIYVHSTDAMDYIWALAFVVGAFWAVFAGRAVMAGVLLGLATACRITSIGMLIPVALYAIHARGRVDARQLTRLVASAATVVLAAYLPAFITYGPGFLSFVDYQPPLDRVLYRASVEVWGVLGVIALAIAAPAAVHCRQRRLPPAIAAPRAVVVAWIAGVAIYGLLYLRLPHEGGYLIPAVPLVILLVGRLLDRRAFVAFCGALVLSPFLLSVDRAGCHVAGAVLRDHEIRRDAHHLVATLIADNDTRLEEKRVVVVGWYEPHIVAAVGANRRGQTQYVSLLSAGDVEDWRQRGYALFYLPEIQDYNRNIHRVDLGRIGATAIVLQ